jgi:hypothetical protein
MTAMTTTADAEYPVRYSVDYPEEPRNRLSVLLRFFFAIPILVILVLLSGGSRGAAVDDGGARIEGPAVERDRGASGAGAAVAGGGVVLAPTVLMLLFRRKYPRWWFDWNRELSRFSSRVSSYMLLLRDEYPSTDEEQAVHLEVDYPDAQQLSRWLPLVKWFLAIPHYLVLALLIFGAFFAVVFAWFAILITGRFPRGLFDYVVGVQRWTARVTGYAFLLVTDRYPPFSTR